MNLNIGLTVVKIIFLFLGLHTPILSQESICNDGIDNDGDGFARSLDYSFTVMGPALAYDTIPGTISPVVRLWYAGPKTGGTISLSRI